jgi:NAD(P)-dependent dehydrogenase (short-subunit alcohol dehydrogenase family)
VEEIAMSQSSRVWLITGVSGGLGRALAEEVLRQGGRVAGTVRKPSQIDAFQALAPGRATGYLLDVTEAKALEPLVGQVLSDLGAIDVLVNNAGYGLAGATEELSEAEIRHQMDTNFFGPLALIRAVLPHMRERRRGHIINISSVAGIVGFPGMPLYSASKFAIEGLSEALAGEVAPLGIKVTAIEPGGFRTQWAGSSFVEAATRMADYAATAGRMAQAVRGQDGVQSGDPVKAARVVIALVESDNPPVRLALGTDAVKRISDKLSAMQAKLGELEPVSRSTSFD